MRSKKTKMRLHGKLKANQTQWKYSWKCMSLLLYVRSPSEIPFGIIIFDVFIRYWRPLLFLLFQQDFFTTTEKKLRTEVDWAPLQSEYERTTWNSKRLSITLKMWSCENHTTTIKITIHKCHISIYIYISVYYCVVYFYFPSRCMCSVPKFLCSYSSREHNHHIEHCYDLVVVSQELMV